jgi:hypothetical protein
VLKWLKHSYSVWQVTVGYYSTKQGVVSQAQLCKVLLPDSPRIIFFISSISEKFPINNVYEINDALTLFQVTNDLASDVKLNLDSFDMRAFIDMWPPAMTRNSSCIILSIPYPGSAEFRR